MITAAWTAARLWFTGLPDGIRRGAVWLALALLTIALVWWWFARHDAKVIERHDEKRAATASEAKERSAEDRANDAIINMINEREREDAIKAAPTGSSVSAPDLQLNCLRLKKLGRVPEPCRHIGGD
ncbi:hypothetical protein LH128_05258 [Sphingomonas sp. LH128]|uniref:hypothetical protein n=1 Tax=Sphingomonas sp. LH128 TaxID=473781 RepID=UPI00027C9B27|nr:hypothetical protein [Sphingomonas sp. LH128]EJU14140.1 hypothetical protein LH128_05258 [Sphingomonas sp. LH128]